MTCIPWKYITQNENVFQMISHFSKCKELRMEFITYCTPIVLQIVVVFFLATPE